MPNIITLSLPMEVLRDAVIVKLGEALAPLQAFSRDFGAEPMAPGKTVVVPLASADRTDVVEDAADFETTNTTIAPVEIAVHQMTKSFGITNRNLQDGLRLQQLAEANAQALGEAIMAKVTALVTTANFPATPVATPAADWGPNGAGIKATYKALAKARSRYAILDPTLYAETMFTQSMSFVLGAGGQAGVSTGPAAYGFTGIYPQTLWEGSTAGTLGFGCDPQAIAVASGTPAAAPQMADSGLSMQAIPLANLGITVALFTWFSTKTRGLWASYDVMFGAAVGDDTAGVLVIPTPPGP